MSLSWRIAAGTCVLPAFLAAPQRRSPATNWKIESPTANGSDFMQYSATSSSVALCGRRTTFCTTPFFLTLSTRSSTSALRFHGEGTILLTGMLTLGDPVSAGIGGGASFFGDSAMAVG